jgi:metal-responsive CopG/Arc/MetJ family transcriptional regulator
MVADNKTRVNISVPIDLANDWKDIAEKYHTTRSAMVEEFLKEVLPIMKEQDPNIIIKKGVLKIADSLKEIGDSIESK